MVYVALARIGAVLVPTMPIYRHDEVLYVLQHSGAKVSVVAGEFRGFDYPDMIADIRALAPELQHVISVRCGERSGVLRFEDLVSGTGVPDTGLLGEPPSADAPHCIIYTSGTESRPKGCLHTLNTITFTVPEMLQVVDALPTTMTGKVQKFLLREAARALADQPS